MALSQSSPVHLGMNVRAGGPFHLLCPQDGVSLPHPASKLPLIPELCLFSSSCGRVVSQNRTRVLHCAVEVFQPQLLKPYLGRSHVYFKLEAKNLFFLRHFKNSLPAYLQEMAPRYLPHPLYYWQSLNIFNQNNTRHHNS